MKKLPTPVFVHAPTGRSGTTYLASLLRLHPDAAVPRKPLGREDWILHFSGQLHHYAGDIERRVGERHYAPDEVSGFGDRLLGELGKGILRAATPHECVASHLVFKTPTLNGLARAHSLFPSARIVVIVRDGRATVESMMRSWPELFDGEPRKATEHWAAATRNLMQLMESMRGELLTLRYEDLYLDTERRLRHVLDFAGLDPDRYDFARAAEVPLRGSSVHRGMEGELTWEAMPRPVDFDPLSRFEHWEAEEHREFNGIAGDCLRAFGYPQVTAASGG